MKNQEGREKTGIEISIVGPQESQGTISGDAQYSIKAILLDGDWFTDIHRLDQEVYIIPMPDSDTLMQKVIPASDIENI